MMTWTTPHRPLLATLSLLLAFTPCTALLAQDNLLQNGEFTEGTTEPWQLDKLEGAEAKMTLEEDKGGKQVLCVEVFAVTPQPYHVNLFQPGLQLEEGAQYELKFRAKATAPVVLSANTLIMQEPWKQIWREEVEVSEEWQEYKLMVTPSESTDIGRLTLGRLGQHAGKYWFADVSLTPVK